MKSVAGKLKLDLAQFRELEAFAQFASDLDTDTKKQIERGRRVTELLKQQQYSPLSVEEQVILIFAVNNGYFDDTPLDAIQKTEIALRDFFTRTRESLLQKIRGGEWNDEIEADMKTSCEEFIKQH